MAEAIFLETQEVKMQISDIAKDWYQHPINEQQARNPKIKTMSIDDFNKTFKITSVKTITGYPFSKKQ